MTKPWEIDEALWARTETLLPVHRPGKRGPVPLDDRKCLQGILFVLYTGINWKHLPPELGFGSGIACDSPVIQLAIITTGGNMSDMKAAQDLVEAIPAVAGRVGRPKCRPEVILADGGYDSRAFRDSCDPSGSSRSSRSAAARRSSDSGSSGGSSSRPSRIFTSSGASGPLGPPPAHA